MHINLFETRLEPVLFRIHFHPTFHTISSASNEEDDDEDDDKVCKDILTHPVKAETLMGWQMSNSPRFLLFLFHQDPKP